VGIASDPAVLFADDFEGYTRGPDLNTRWDAVYQNQYVTITTEAANVYRGAKALEFTIPQRDAELSDATDKVLAKEQDVLFLRYYSKIRPPYDVVGSSHNGSSISAPLLHQRAGHARRARQRHQQVPGQPRELAGRGRDARRPAISTSTSITPSSAASGAITSSPPAWCCPTRASPTTSARAS
jgi:hypothetical protein